MAAEAAVSVKIIQLVCSVQRLAGHPAPALTSAPHNPGADRALKALLIAGFKATVCTRPLGVPGEPQQRSRLLHGLVKVCRQRERDESISATTS